MDVFVTESISLSLESTSGHSISVPLEPTAMSGLGSLAALIFATYAEKYGLEEFSNQTGIAFRLEGQLNIQSTKNDVIRVDEAFSSDLQN